jgi:hypothetical protein
VTRPVWRSICSDEVRELGNELMRLVDVARARGFVLVLVWIDPNHAGAARAEARMAEPMS